MDDLCTYQIEVRGQIDGKELNANSPLVMFLKRQQPEATTFTVETDQSGLIGLMRHLHARGVMLMSITVFTERFQEE